MNILPYHVRSVQLTERMESVAKRIIESYPSDINDIITELMREKGFSQEQRLWIMFKVSQVIAGRNIIGIATEGLRVMGVDP